VYVAVSGRYTKEFTVWSRCFPMTTKCFFGGLLWTTNQSQQRKKPNVFTENDSYIECWGEITHSQKCCVWN
jgi:hypothetical protein